MRAFITLAAVLTVAAFFAGVAPGGDESEPHFKNKAAQADIVALSYHLDAPDVSERAKRVVQEHESEHISSIFGPVRRGGHGVGKLLGDDNRMSIQHLVGRWSSRPPTKRTRRPSRGRPRRPRDSGDVGASPHRKPNNPSPEAEGMGRGAGEFHDSRLGSPKSRQRIIGGGEGRGSQVNNTCCHCHELVE